MKKHYSLVLTLFLLISLSSFAANGNQDQDKTKKKKADYDFTIFKMFDFSEQKNDSLVKPAIRTHFKQAQKKD